MVATTVPGKPWKRICSPHVSCSEQNGMGEIYNYFGWSSRTRLTVRSHLMLFAIRRMVILWRDVVRHLRPGNGRLLQTITLNDTLAENSMDKFKYMQTESKPLIARQIMWLSFDLLRLTLRRFSEAILLLTPPQKDQFTCTTRISASRLKLECDWYRF
jgi:hypothetical protein